MDEKPKCSHDVEPITQQPRQKDQSVAQENQTPLKEEIPAPKLQTVLTKDSPVYTEDQSTAPKNQTVLTIDQAIYTIDQPALLKKHSVHSKEELAHPKDERGHPKDQLATFSKDQPACSKLQNPLAGDLGATFSKEQLACSKLQTALKKDQPSVTKEETSFPKIHIVGIKNKSSPPEGQTATSTVHMDSTKVILSSLKDQTAKQTGSTKGESTSTREQTITPKIAKTKDELLEKQILTTEAGSTKNESAMKAYPKNTLEALMENYSKKFEPGISLCAVRASPNSSYNIINGYISSNAPLKISSCTQSPVTTQPVSQMPLAAPSAVISQPPSLFLQALSKLNESSLTLAVISHFKLQSSSELSKVCKIESGEITPPDSLSSAPPTYSFVLRQLAVRRRPRFMGTFFPSPSFVQHAPPPTYTGAFDVYIEPALPSPPTRVYSFGFASMLIVCPECGYTGMTVVSSRVTICTHLCALILCLLCCWICAPLPYILRSCKDVYHYCRNCRSFLGMYCPTNPESAAYPTVT